MIENRLIKQITSPLRYPGGKGLLMSYFSDLMKQNDLTGCRYFEPFAGGAGVALGLLSKGVASEISLNDADYHIYCFWKAIIEHNQQFIDRLNSVPLSIEEWGKQKEIYLNPKKHTIFEVAFSSFFLNRCNRSGIIAGAGPIGGYEQQGEWRLDARFNKTVLTERIVRIGMMKKYITIQNMDAIEFLKTYLPKGKGRKNVLVYCDPPYVSAGNKLYLNFYQNNDHQRLAKYLLAQNGLKWVASYDDNPLIRKLYTSCQKWIFSLGYSLQACHKGRELLIAPDYVVLPGKDAIATARWNLIRKINVSNKPTEVMV
jgi:DNA adenine methylase